MGKRIVVEIIAIFVVCLVVFTSLDFDPTLSTILVFIAEPIGIFAIEYLFASKDRKERKIAQENARRELEKAAALQKEKFRQAAEGTWAFPETHFYLNCEAENITAIDSSYAEQKAAAIARRVLRANDIPNEYHDRYCRKEKLIQYFENGKKQAAIDKARQEEELRKPKWGEITESEKQTVLLAEKMKPLYGISKRIAMLDDTIGKINKKIHDYEEGQKALKEVAFLLGSSVSQEKKKDWAFLGGLADGIAGPAAGVSVALNAMAENQEIERRNQLARQEAMKTVKSFYDSSFQLSNDIDELNNRKRLIENYKWQAQTKVVLEEYNTEDIFQSIKTKGTVEKTSNGRGTKLSISVQNNFVADVPENVLVAVDGTLNAEIYFENTLVDTVCICLPLFGIATGTSERIVAYTDRYVEADGRYTVKIKPNNLWIVEV